METRYFHCRVPMRVFLLVWLIFFVHYVTEMLIPHTASLYSTNYIYVGFLIAGIIFGGLKTACVRVTQTKFKASVFGIPIIALALDDIKKVMPSSSRKRTLNIFTMGRGQITIVYGHGKMQNFSLIDNEGFLTMMSHCYTHDGFSDSWTNYGEPARSMRVIRAFLALVYLAINGVLSFGNIASSADLWMYSLSGIIGISFANVLIVGAYVKSFGEKLFGKL